MNSSSAHTPLRQRARAATTAELDAIPWLAILDADQRSNAIAQLQVADAEVDERVCRIGRTANFWFGVIDGLLKMSNDDSSGPAITFTGLPPGGWFGEGTLLKRETYRYNVQALRRSVVAGLPLETFHHLLEHSIPFNRFMLNQLNERLSQFISAREIDRISDPDLRVARNLAELSIPQLPLQAASSSGTGAGRLLRITQRELGYLVGLSRQRVNQALNALAERQLISIEYGGLRVLDLQGLRRFPQI
ncbi:Crp/Fnr family transcriptional regulator [Roseateles sp. GG27B]